MNQMIDEVYEKYCEIAGKVEEPDYDIHVDDPNQNCTRLMTKEEFINKCKINPEFSERWGLKIEERELNHDERFEIYKNSNIGGRVLQNHITAINFKQFHFDEANIPTRAISLMWNQRSVDTFLGLPFNIASYGLLLTMLADEVNMVPDQLIGNLGDTHIYLNHIEQAKEQIGREPMDLPTVHVRDGIFCSSVNDIILENYQSHPAIKAPLSN